jgi:hypothetical protein
MHLENKNASGGIWYGACRALYGAHVLRALNGSFFPKVATLVALTTVSGGLVMAGAKISLPSGGAIIRDAVAVNARDWSLQTDFSHTEVDVKNKIDTDGHVQGRGSRTFDVLMIDGSPYERLVGINNEPLNHAQQESEEAKLNREIAVRRSQSASERKTRIQKYQSERADEHLLMQQMVAAFDFKLMGEEQVEGVDCYKFAATPRADYNPPVEKARVLKGMQGQMWIDRRQFHWVKVQAEVTEPVTFGFFIAKVNPGTRFELEQAPFGNFWFPKHFVQTVRASVFGIYGYRSREETFYSNYRPIATNETVRASLR